MSTIRFSQYQTTQDILNISCLFQKFSMRKLNHISVKDCIKNYPHILAYDNNSLIGFLYTHNFAPDILELYNLFIHPDYRYQSIGTLMLQHLIENVERQYRGIIVINSSLYNDKGDFVTAVPFYTRNDFDIIAKTDNTSVLYHTVKEKENK